MEKDKLIEMADRFIHNELSAEEETFFLSQLSENSEVKEYFKNEIVLNEALKAKRKDYPSSLDDKILQATIFSEKEDHFFKEKFFGYVGLLVAALFFIISLSLFSELNNNRREINDIKKIVNYQNKVIGLFMNSLPAAQVNETLNNEVIIKRNL